MSEEDTYQALKEILPELESKLRQNIQQEYQEELQKVQMFYKKYAEDMINKKEVEIRRQTEATESHLRRELSLIQRERQQWLTLQQNYRRTIFELTERIKDNKHEADLSSLTEILQQNVATQPDKPDPQMTSWRKKNKFEANNQSKASRKNSQNSIINNNTSCVSKVLKEMTECNEELPLEERPLKGNETTKRWKIGDKGTITADDDRAKRQDTLVLSPPKMEEGKSMKNSLLQPPSQPVPSKASVFWNQQGKKKFLSMIRSIK